MRTCILVSFLFGTFGFSGGWILKDLAEGHKSKVVRPITLSQALGVEVQNVLKIDVGGEVSECTFAKADGSWPTLEQKGLSIGKNSRPATLDGQISRFLELPVIEISSSKEEVLKPSLFCGTPALGCENIYVETNAVISIQSSKRTLQLHFPWDYHACTDGLCPDFVLLSAVDDLGKSRSFVASWSRWQFHRLSFQAPDGTTSCEW